MSNNTSRGKNHINIHLVRCSVVDVSIEIEGRPEGYPNYVDMKQLLENL